MDGFLLDVTYVPPPRRGEPGQAVVWFKDDAGRTHRLAEPFTPLVYVRSRDLDALQGVIPLFPGAGRPFRARGKCGLSETEEDVLAVPVPDARHLPRLVQAIDAHGDFRDHELFDADLRLSHRYFVGKGVFPFARMRAWAPGRYRLLDEQWRTDYAPPDLKTLWLDVKPDTPRGRIADEETPLASATVGERVFDRGGERTILQAIHDEVMREDPDVIMTRGGDTFAIPYLYARAQERGVDLVLGREPANAKGPQRKSKSFFSYGRIKWRAPTYALAGRIHLDVVSSFFYAESGLSGLIDLSRVARVPLQEMARLGAGTAVTAIQIDLAKREGRLIPWKKNAPEAFKTARELLVADRGGYIFEPRVGLHDDVVELDFASLYPNIMVHRNISPEVILCGCCAPPNPDSSDGASLGGSTPFSWNERMKHRAVPQLGTWTCARRLGFIPRAIGPVVLRREHFKRMRKLDPEHRKEHQERVDVYKWLLVTSFGYQGYKNAKFGRIECHEAIGAWGREILLTATEAAREFGFERVHGIVDSLWLAREDKTKSSLPTSELAMELSQVVEEEVGIRFEYEGRYKWIVFLPNRTHPATDNAPAVGALNRYYGCFDTPPEKPNRSQPGQAVDQLAGGALKVRGVEYRQHSTPPVMQEAQRRFLETLAPAEDAPSVLRLLPDAIDSVAPILARVRAGDAKLDDLVHTNMVSQAAEDYRSNTLAASAAKLLLRANVRVEPGQAVRYVVLDRDARAPHERVVEARLMRGDETYDRAHYEQQLLRAIASLALPFGWDEARLAERFDATRPTSILAWA